MSMSLFGVENKVGLGVDELAMIALRTDQALYNVHTGLCLIPEIDEDGTLWGLDCGRILLDELYRYGRNGLPFSAKEYVKEPPARLSESWQVEESGFVDDAWHDNLRQISTTLAYIAKIMNEEGDGWTFADPYSIAEMTGRIPDRYLSESYPNSYGHSETFHDLVASSGGSLAVAMRVADMWSRDANALPRGAAELVDKANDGEVDRIAGTYFPTNGHQVSFLDVYGRKALEIEFYDYLFWHCGTQIPFNKNPNLSDRRGYDWRHIDSCVNTGLSFGDVLGGILDGKELPEIIGESAKSFLVVRKLALWLGEITTLPEKEILKLINSRGREHDGLDHMIAKWDALPSADELFLDVGDQRTQMLSGTIEYDGVFWICKFRNSPEDIGYGDMSFVDREDAVSYIESEFQKKGYLVDHSTAHEAKLKTDRAADRLLEPTPDEWRDAALAIYKESLASPRRPHAHLTEEEIRAKVMEMRKAAEIPEQSLESVCGAMRERRSELGANAPSVAKNNSIDNPNTKKGDR